MKNKKICLLRWPYPYKLAFGITDDTDECTLEDTQKVYEYAIKLGIMPTKTVWIKEPLRCCGVLNKWKPDSGETLQNDEYRNYCKSLSKRGIELAMHGVSSGNNTRSEIIDGLEDFRATFDYYPRLYICHNLNAENPYWGESNFKFPGVNLLIRFMTIYNKEKFYGHIPNSPYYWIDICKEKIQYIRLFRTRDLNVLHYNPMMPYHQYDKPGVKFWFSACSGDLEIFRRVSHQSIDRIAREDGALIIYAHSAYFIEKRKLTKSGLKQEVERAFQIISSRNDVWCTNVSNILDRCLVTKNLLLNTQRNGLVITNPTDLPINNLQFRFIADGKKFYLSSEEIIHPDKESIYHIKKIDAHSSITLYLSREEKKIGDPMGISSFEHYRMAFQECKRLLWSKWRKYKKKTFA